MIVRGVIANGGWQAGNSGELLIRIAVDEMNTSGAAMTPANLRGRTATLVLGDAPELPEGFYQFSQPDAASSGGDDAQMVDAGTTPPTVVEHEHA